MLKKNILFVILILSFLGCSIPPFNTKANLEYNITGVETEYTDVIQNEVGNNEFFIEIPIVNKNSVAAKVIKVTAKVNGSSYDLKILEGSGEWDIKGNTTNTLKVNPFMTSDSKTITFGTTNSIKIEKVKFVDQNDNDVSLGEITKSISVVKYAETSDEVENEDPKIPINLSFEITGDEKAKLSWEDPNMSEGEEQDTNYYNVYRVQAEEYDEEDLILNNEKVYNTTITDEDVTTGTIYYYVVKVFDNAGNSSTYSKPVRVKILGSGDYQVTDFQGQAKDETKYIELTWTNPTNTTNSAIASLMGYKIYREKVGSGEGFSEVKNITDPQVESWTDESQNLEERLEYRYKIIAYDELDNQGDPSYYPETVNKGIAVNDVTGPSAVSGLDLELMSDFKIKASWNQVTDETLTSYKIEATTSSSFATSDASIVTTSTSAIYTETTLNGKYKEETVLVRIQAIDGEGNPSVWSNIKVIGVNYEDVITAPEITEASSGEDFLMLSWTKPDVNTEDNLQIAHYKLDYSANISFDDLSTTGGSITTDDNGLSSNIDMSNTSPGTFYVRVTPVGENDEIGKTSDPKRVKFLNKNAPIIQENEIWYDMMIDTDEDGDEVKGVKITWENKTSTSPAIDVDSYYIYRKSSSDGEFTKIGEVDNTTGSSIRYIDPIPSGSEYWYQVSCVTSGGEGQPSGEIHIIDNGAPSKITGVEVQAQNEYDAPTSSAGITIYGTDTNLLVSWGGYTPPRDFSLYKVYISKLKLYEVDKDGNKTRLPDNSASYDMIENSNANFKLVKTTVANVNVSIDPKKVFPEEYDDDSNSGITGRYVIKVTCVDQLGNESEQSQLVYAYNRVPEEVRANVSAGIFKDDAVQLSIPTSGTWEIYKSTDDTDVSSFYKIGEGTGEYSDDKVESGTIYHYRLKYKDPMGNVGQLSETSVSVTP